jgi:cytochrome c oxidase subunit 4
MKEILPSRALVLTWVALLALVGSTLGLAFVPLGTFNLVVALTIATAKTILVLIVFMKVARSSHLTWAFAGAGLFWLAILFTLASTDYLTRVVVPA